MAAALAVLGVCASVSVSAIKDEFTYVKEGLFRRADEEDCKICYEDNDCLTINQARCEFYTETSALLFDDDEPEDSTNPELRFQVDSLMMAMVEHSSSLPASQECVPFVSQYTDCTKENICLGCRSCTCTENSMWSCSSVQRYRPEEQLKVDHRALVIAVETLRGDGNPSFKLKRSISTTDLPKTNFKTFEEIAEWMYEVKPLNDDDYTNTTEAASTNGTTGDKAGVLSAVRGTTMSDNIENTNVEDNVEFDDVLHNIAVQSQNYNRRKTLNTIYNANALEHMKLDGVNVTFYNMNEMNMVDQLVNVLNDIQGDEPEEETTTESVNKVVIDLLELARRRIDTTGNDYTNTDNKITLQNDTEFDDTSNLYEFNTNNIMKRDASQVMKENHNGTVSEKNNDTNTSKELKDTIYHPISAIIKDKQKELEDLLRAREKLIEYLSPNRSNEYVVLNKSEKIENSSNSYISFYNIQIVPQPEYDTKRSGDDLLDKYLKKLRRDVYVVIKDIVSIQTITGPEDFPQNIKVLTHAIKHFMRNHTKAHKKKILRSFDNIYDLRRHQDSTYMTKDFVKNNLINILLLIDRDISDKNALSPLSMKIRKIVKRVVRNNKMNDVSVIGLTLNDPNYNMTNDLKSIGINWQDMTVKITESLPWDRLHNMKLLQFFLEADIGKMKDALALIDFAHSRRMVAIHDEVSKDELLRINKNLRSIHGKIRDIKKLPNVKKPGSKVVKVFTISKQNKKETFLKHIRNLLKSSKKDIVNLLRKKVPKSLIVKELAKKKLSELTKKKLIEYENVMQTWQNNLDITRNKRSFEFDKLNIRTKNILPKYLRGKVSSGMNSTKHKNKKPKHSERRKRKKNKKKNTPVAATTEKKMQ